MVSVALRTRLNFFNATYESKENKTSVPQMECNKLQKLKIVGSFYCIVDLFCSRCSPWDCFQSQAVTTEEIHIRYSLGAYLMLICDFGVFYISIFLPWFIRVSPNRDCSWWFKDEAPPFRWCEGFRLHFQVTSTRDYCFHFLHANWFTCRK